MLYNKLFTTYRRETSSGKRQYSATATLENVPCLFQLLAPELRATLGIDNSREVYILQTDEIDFERSDKVVVDSVSYYIEEIDRREYNGIEISELLINKEV